MKQESKSNSHFNKVDEMVSLPSSCRASSFRNMALNLEEEQKINFQQQGMRNIRQKIFMKKVIKQLQGLVALQKTPDSVTEEWQDLEENDSLKTSSHQLPLQEEIYKLYPWMRITHIIQGISMVLFIWFISVAIVFQEKNFDGKLFLVVAIQVLNLTFQFLIINCDNRFASVTEKFKKKKLINPFIIVGSCLAMFLRTNIDNFAVTIIEAIMFVVCFYLAKKVPSYFRVIKAYAEDKKLIKQLRIIELFCVLLVVMHIFGLIIYSSVYLKPEGEKTWLMSDGISLNYKPWYTKYLYSVYFAITTIVTVGYGDLTPQNEAEVLVIMILEICGTSFFGYMINVIGITVDNINKKNQEYDNYQETISKLKDNYQLSDELCFQMKRDIEKKYNDQEKAVSLKKNEEMDFLDYVDSTVKKNFILETNIKIIKKSIFFLTYFTVSFQNYVAMKLIRVIYKKDENIDTYDPVTRQRNIIIVNHGKVNLFIEKRQNNIVKSKLVRTIQPIEGKPAMNVIGYSSLILNMDNLLFAKASEMTSGYVLRVSDVLECIDKSMVDYESFHEMRQKMLLIAMKESIEAPSLKDSNYHYSPNIFILSARFKIKEKHRRKKFLRKSKRGFLFVDKVKAQLEKNCFTVNHEDFQEDSASQIKEKQENIDDFGSLLSVDLQIPYEENSPKVNEIVMKSEEKEEVARVNVDQVKIFEYFMRNHNINHVAAQYEESCRCKTYNKRIQTWCLKTEGGKKELSRFQNKVKSIPALKKTHKLIPIRL